MEKLFENRSNLLDIEFGFRKLNGLDLLDVFEKLYTYSIVMITGEGTMKPL